MSETFRVAGEERRARKRFVLYKLKKGPPTPGSRLAKQTISSNKENGTIADWPVERMTIFKKGVTVV